MYLKRLEIQGFKTFAGRTVLEFRPGVTAVVGPNGSGKSNITDAVRWVLGEQSLTNLRCKRTEELLFAGGPRRPPAGFAEVSLTIDNSDRLLPVAFDEVTLTRRATRAGEQEYYLNRSRVRLRDLQEAVEPLGGSYTIVNQGLVDAALTLRPEERRRLFEDAAEIGGFELRKQEAERRLRETDANLQRLADLLSELEPRVRLLKRQAAQARQHGALNAELQGLQQRYYAILWAAAHRSAMAAEQNQQRLERDLAAARARQHNAGRELHRRREELRDSREQLGALHQASSALHRRAEAAQRDLAVAQERAAALTRRAEDLARARQELALRRADAEREQLAAGTALAAGEAELLARRAQLAALEQELAAAEQERRGLARELAAAEETALKTAAAEAEARSQIDRLRAQRERLLHDRAELEYVLAQAEERLGQARAQQEQAHAALAAAEAVAAEAAAAEQHARSELEAARAARTGLDEQRAAARRNLADAEAQFDSLSRLARSYTGTFAGVRAAMQWAERAGRPGFALVSSLIRTPPELETAIEVALGSRLQNIVVNYWHDAEEAIAELKRSGAGRATFLPLDSLRGADSQTSGHQPAGGALLGIAADLVAYDSPYAAVVRQLLGRTLIAADLAAARNELRRLSGGWTIVTLGGEQLNAGGALTGGAQTKESGTLRRERELRELPARVAAAREALEAIERRRSELESRITILSQALRERETHGREAGRARETARAALEAAARRLAGAEQERGWQSGRHTRMAAELVSLDEQEARAAVLSAETAGHAHAARERLAALRARREAEGETGRLAQEQLAELRGAVAGVEAQLKAGRSLLAAHTRNAERLAQQLAALERDEQALQHENEQLQNDRQADGATHQALLAEIDLLRARIEPAEAELRQREAGLAALESAEEQATAALLEYEAAYSQARVEAQRTADRRENMLERAAADGIDLVSDLPIGEPDGAVENTVGQLARAIEALKAKILRLGAVNPLALEEYEETAERQQFLAGQIDDLQQAGVTLRELIAELDEAMNARFASTFKAVAAEFERSFSRLFGGGSASLQLVGGAESTDPEAEPGTPVPRSFGIEIIARPPGKRAQNISLLSGGERALTAAALLFAILTVNPSPFCILDEVDAALDESNVGRFREALAELTGTTQFIIVTHNRGTIEVADTLYGVSMGEDGASRVLSLRLETYMETT